MASIRAELTLKSWNAVQLKARVPVIIRRYRDVLDPQLKQEIKTVQFEWPNTTRRRNKSVVRSPRDIVDLGTFLRSQRVETPDATTLRFVWDATSDKGYMYAGIILTGYQTASGRVMPPRNWIKPALDKYPLDQFFIQEWRKLAGRNL